MNNIHIKPSLYQTNFIVSPFITGQHFLNDFGLIMVKYLAI